MSKTTTILLRYFLLIILTGCGYVTCDGINNEDNSCTFLQQVTPTAAISIPDLPSLEEIENASSTTQYSTYVPANQPTWQYAQVQVQSGDILTIKIEPSSQYPATGSFITNGTINQCYKNDIITMTGTNTTSQSWSSAGTGPIHLIALFNPLDIIGAKSDHNWQYIYQCTSTDDCDDPVAPYTIPNCLEFPNDSGVNCAGRDGEGLTLMVNNAQISDGSQPWWVTDATLDSTNSFFHAGSLYYNADALNQTLDIALNFSSWNGGYQAYYTNYVLNHLTTGCFAVNGVVDYPQVMGPQAGQLRYTIGSSSSEPPTDKGVFIEGSSLQNIQISQPGYLYLQIYESDNAADYADNVGYYEVQMIVQHPSTIGFVSVLSDVTDSVKQAIQQTSASIYGNITNNYNFIHIVKLCLLLYIVIYGVSFSAGMVKISQRDLLIRAVKIAVILALLSENSYYFFNIYFFRIFTGGITYLTEMISGTQSGVASTSTASLFDFASITLTYLGHPGVIIRFLVFFFIPKIGIFLASLIIVAVGMFFVSVLQAFIAYLLALTGIYIFISMAPLFIILILFEHTKQIFDQWVKLLAGFVLQTVILFGCIWLVNIMILDTVNNLLSEVNYKCLIPFVTPSPFQFYFFCIVALLPSVDQPVLMFALCVMLYIATDLMKKLPVFVETMSHFISFGAGQLSEKSTELLSSAKSFGQKALGIDKQSKSRRKVAKTKKALGTDKPRT